MEGRWQVGKYFELWPHTILPLVHFIRDVKAHIQQLCRSLGAVWDPEPYLKLYLVTLPVTLDTKLRHCNLKFMSEIAPFYYLWYPAVNIFRQQVKFTFSTLFFFACVWFPGLSGASILTVNISSVFCLWCRLLFMLLYKEIVWSTYISQ